MSSKEAKSYKYTPAILAIDKDLAFSKDSAWVYVELPLQPFEFLGTEERVSHAKKISQGLQGLVKSGSKSVECLLHVTSVPFDDHAWIETLSTQTRKADPSAYWNEFADMMQSHVRKSGFRDKQVFLSVQVGKRAEYKNNEVSGGLEKFKDYTTKLFGVTDPVVSDKEIAYWHTRAEEIRRVLRFGALGAKPVSANTIARLLQETLYPSMPMPDVSVNRSQTWGKGAIDGISTADITNHKKFLRIEQPDVSATGEKYGMSRVGYRATLSFSRFPDSLNIGNTEPWMHFASSLSFPANLYSRFTIVPSTKVEKDVDKFKKTVEDQINNSGKSSTMAMQEQFYTAQEVKYRLEKERSPWIYGRHRIVVSAPTEEMLRDRVQETIDHYKNLDIDVTWSTGDQLRLLQENQPADSVRVNAYHQRQELNIIAVGMPTGAGKVGDSVFVNEKGEKRGWLGPYVGYTTSRVIEPCHISIHSAIAKNNPNGLVITGSPGGGKSFFAFTLTYIMTLQGVWCIYIDPKGDALPMSNLPGLEGIVDTFDLKNGHDGLLEPFLLSNDLATQKLLALETCLLFLGSEVTSAQNAILTNTIRQVASQPSPGLNKVIDKLLSDTENPEAVSMGGNLELISELPFARLCFSDGKETSSGNRSVIQPDKGLTIVSLQSLDLPATSDNSNYSTSERLAVGIMYLLATFTESLMSNADRSHPKAVVIDEAWAITSTKEGKNMIPRLARMGRALNTALVLVSQNAKDFLNLTNNMSYRCAFRTRDTDEIRDVLKFFNLETEGPAGKGNAETIAELENGECLIKDPDGKISRVQIDSWNQQMKYAFDTNPETRGKKNVTQ